MCLPTYFVQRTHLRCSVRAEAAQAEQLAEAANAAELKAKRRVEEVRAQRWEERNAETRLLWRTTVSHLTHATPGASRPR